jgi:LuxR family capsular biosynthesis transcriptional activator
MSVIILDSCNYIKFGLEYYFRDRKAIGVQVRKVNDFAELILAFSEHQPEVIFLSEKCFIHKTQYCLQMKKMIDKNENTLFIVFLSIDNSYFEHCLWVRDNVLIASKSLSLYELNRLLNEYKNNNQILADGFRLPVFTLSCSECCVLQMWLSGCSTAQISTMMNVKIKTVFSHKASINIKIKATKKQVVFHMVHIINSITSGIPVKGCLSRSSSFHHKHRPAIRSE